ncbi:MAG TPA: hypothetical protein VKA60_08585 [Blastocatellia bacterium]|nr:hypothetical protein [Blastocatellia bacterium]
MTDQASIRRAFELAYFIHANQGIAMCIAEEAWCKLEHTFGRQRRRRYYTPGRQRRTQAGADQTLRTKVSFGDDHLLQLLVYAESDYWERSTEYADSPYPLAEDDMVIRFIKRLVQITVRRNSFYVALGLSRLLYDYGTSEARQIYDMLTQDHSRFRDNSYFRKQKKILMRELLARFKGMIRVARTPQREYRFLAQPPTERLIDLADECLQRFTPWDTACVIEGPFDSTEPLPAFSFTGTNPDDEAPVEMRRIHAVLHPRCFSRLVASLGYDAPRERLAVPQFFFSDDNRPRGNRFKPPALTTEHYLQFQRARKDRAGRRKALFAGRLRVYVDGTERAAFDARRTAKLAFKIGPEANVIEVRGRDAEGELALATLLMRRPGVAAAETLRDRITLEGGQRVTISLTPVLNARQEVKETHVQLTYAETHPARAIAWWARRAWLGLSREDSAAPATGYSWLLKGGVIAALLLSLLGIIWLWQRPVEINLPSPPEIAAPPPPQVEPPPAPPHTPVAPRVQPTPSSVVASAAWDTRPDAARLAIRIGPRRGSLPSINVARPQTTLLLALARADADDKAYRRYRITLAAADEAVWTQTLQAIIARTDSDTNVVRVKLFPRQFPQADSYRLRIEGETIDGWQALGQVVLQPVGK